MRNTARDLSITFVGALLLGSAEGPNPPLRVRTTPEGAARAG